MNHNDAICLAMMHASSLGWYVARREVGLYLNTKSGRPVKIGVRGEADIQGIAPPDGRAIAIECKTGAASLSPEQKKWRDMWIAKGGIYIVARPDKPGWQDSFPGAQ